MRHDWQRSSTGALVVSVEKCAFRGRSYAHSSGVDNSADDGIIVVPSPFGLSSVCTWRNAWCRQRARDSVLLVRRSRFGVSERMAERIRAARSGAGWTSRGEFLCILRNGTILLYRDLKEELFDPASDDAMRAGPLPVLSNIFSLCSAAQHIDDDDDDVHLVHHWRGGAVILTDKMRILCVFVLDGGEFHIDDFGRLPINPAKPPRCMAVLCPEIACHKSVDEMEIAIALGERSGILVVSNSGEGVEARVPTFEADAAVCLAAHPTDRFLAVFGMNGFLHVVPVEFDKHIICQNCTDEICDATTLKTEFPTSVCWMGTSDAIAVFWNMAPGIESPAAVS